MIDLKNKANVTHPKIGYVLKLNVSTKLGYIDDSSAEGLIQSAKTM